MFVRYGCVPKSKSEKYTELEQTMQVNEYHLAPEVHPLWAGESGFDGGCRAIVSLTHFSCKFIERTCVL